jgi:hypothetical protein
MLKFKHINYTTCPNCQCAAHTVSFEHTYSYRGEQQEIRVHCNGTRWETIEFLCGRKDQYSPNFSSIVTQSPCRNTVEEKTKLAMRDAADQTLKDAIRGMKVDPEYRAKLFRNAGFYTEAREVEEAAKPRQIEQSFRDIEDEFDDDEFNADENNL